MCKVTREKESINPEEINLVSGFISISGSPTISFLMKAIILFSKMAISFREMPSVIDQ
jgi:hypothetical protein